MRAPLLRDGSALFVKSEATDLDSPPLTVSVI